MIGLWPEVEMDPRERLKCHLHTLAVVLLITFGFLLPYILSFIKIRKDPMLLIENLQVLLPVTTCIVRLICLWWKKEDVTPVICMIVQDWRDIQNELERSVMIMWAQRTRIVIIIGYCMMTISCFCVMILPICGISLTYITNATESHKILPLKTYEIYNSDRRPQYELTYVSQVTASFFAAITYTGIDTFLCMLVFHICGQLNILSARISCLDKLTKFRCGLKKYVMHHIRLLRAIDIIEDTYNIILLILFLHFGVLFAVYGFHISVLLGNKNSESANMSRMPFFICNVINIFFHMGLYCTVGELLVEQKWYTMDARAVKHLILLMVRSEEPPYITAGKMFPVTMATFCNLVKTSAGYMSVLHTTRS